MNTRIRTRLNSILVNKKHICAECLLNTSNAFEVNIQSNTSTIQIQLKVFIFLIFIFLFTIYEKKQIT